jgi:hypothetical protein
MILFFDFLSIIAASIGLYYLLGTQWKDMDAHARADAILASSLLAIISTLALAASLGW